MNTKKTLTDQGGANTIISDQTLVVGKIEAQGDVSLLAMAQPNDSPWIDFKGAGDICITGAEVTSIDGHVALTAARDLDVVNDVTVDKYYETYYQKKKRLFSSTITQRVTSTVDQTIEQSRVAGNTVSMAAGHDLTVAASDIQATGSIGMHADNNLELLSTAEMDSNYEYSRVTKKGIFSDGPWSLSIGSKTVTNTRTEVNTLQTGASVSSTLGDINLSAGNQLTQMSSEVLAPAGSIRMAAKEVVVSTNNNTNSLLNTLQIKQAGVTLSASHLLVTAYNTVKDMERARKRTSSGHTQAMAVMVSALTLERAFKDLPNAASFNEVSNYLAPNRWSLSVTLGTSVYDSRSYSYSTLPVESSIVAGRDVSIVATGEAAQEQGRISIIGSAVTAGGALTLQAKDSINLQAAKAKQTNDSQETSRSASVGMNFSGGKDGVGVSATVAASRMRGFTNGHGMIYYPVALTAGLIDGTGLLNLSAGTDLDIQGATLSGYRVLANAGRNFTMRSVQDESFYAAAKKSWGFNLSVPIPVPGAPTPPPSASLGISYSQMKLMSDFQSAKEQTAIRAGAGGFEIYVNGQTKLVGSVIASNGEPEYDYLATGTLVMEHLQNKENVSGEAKALQLNISQDPKTAVSFGGSAYGFAELDRSTLGHTNAAIASGVVISVTDPKKQVAITPGLSSASSRWDASLAQTRQSLITNTNLRAACASTDATCQSKYDKLIRSNNRNITDFENLRATDISNQYISGINRNVSAAHQPVAPTFDARQATDDLELGASTMVKFVQAGYKRVGDMAQPEVDKSEALKRKAELAASKGDQAAANSYRLQAQEIDKLWGNTGTYRLALHALVGGIAWGAPGALGNAANVMTETVRKTAVEAAMKAVGLDPATNATTRDVLLGLTSTVVGAAAGGAQGAAAAFNADANNRQLHPKEVTLIMSKKAALVQRLAQNGIVMDEAQAERMLTALVAKDVKQYSMVGEFSGMYNGKAVDVATAFMNEIGQQAGSFVDYRGQTIQYFKASDADYRKKDLYISEYNTVELQDFAYRTQGLNLIGSNPSPAALNNFVAHKVQKNQETKVLLAGVFGPGLGFVALGTAGPALATATSDCLGFWQLCASRLSLAFTDALASPYLGGTSVISGLAAAEAAVLQLERKMASEVDDLMAKVAASPDKSVIQKALDLAKPTGNRSNPNEPQVMAILDDGRRVVFRKETHPLDSGPFTSADGPIFHYNIDLQSASGKKIIENIHIVPDGKGSFIWWGRNGIVKP